MKKEIFTFSTKDICEISVLCALAIVLDRFIKIPLGITGGSINISMVPLFIIALRHGPFKSFIAGGIVYGFITCLLDGYGLVCYPLEYFVAFGAVGIMGIFAKKINILMKSKNTYNFILSVILMFLITAIIATIRVFGATIDSMILWDYTFGPALIYNATYIYPSALGSLIILIVILPTISILNIAMPSTHLK